MFDIPKNHSSISEVELKKYLDLLEKSIDIEHVRDAEKRQLKVFNFDEIDRLPILISTRDDVAHQTAAGIDWPEFSFGQMWNDYGAMLLNELRPVYIRSLFCHTTRCWPGNATGVFTTSVAMVIIY